MKVGPTVRTPWLPVVVFEGAVFEGSLEAAGAVLAGALPFAGAGLVGACDCDTFFAFSSVTTMSPCWAAVDLSSMFFSASAQLWPAALHEQVGLNFCR